MWQFSSFFFLFYRVRIVLYRKTVIFYCERTRTTTAATVTLARALSRSVSSHLFPLIPLVFLARYWSLSPSLFISLLSSCGPRISVQNVVVERARLHYRSAIKDYKTKQKRITRHIPCWRNDLWENAADANLNAARWINRNRGHEKREREREKVTRRTRRPQNDRNYPNQNFSSIFGLYFLSFLYVECEIFK